MNEVTDRRDYTRYARDFVLTIKFKKEDENPIIHITNQVPYII